MARSGSYLFCLLVSIILIPAFPSAGLAQPSDTVTPLQRLSAAIDEMNREVKKSLEELHLTDAEPATEAVRLVRQKLEKSELENAALLKKALETLANGSAAPIELQVKQLERDLAEDRSRIEVILGRIREKMAGNEARLATAMSTQDAKETLIIGCGALFLMLLVYGLASIFPLPWKLPETVGRHAAVSRHDGKIRLATRAELNLWSRKLPGADDAFSLGLKNIQTSGRWPFSRRRAMELKLSGRDKRILVTGDMGAGKMTSIIVPLVYQAALRKDLSAVILVDYYNRNIVSDLQRYVTVLHPGARTQTVDLGQTSALIADWPEFLSSPSYVFACLPSFEKDLEERLGEELVAQFIAALPMQAPTNDIKEVFLLADGGSGCFSAFINAAQKLRDRGYGNASLSFTYCVCLRNVSAVRQTAAHDFLFTNFPFASKIFLPGDITPEEAAWIARGLVLAPADVQGFGRRGFGSATIFLPCTPPFQAQCRPFYCDQAMRDAWPFK